MELVMEQEARQGGMPHAGGHGRLSGHPAPAGRSADTLAAYRRSIYGCTGRCAGQAGSRGTLDRWRETLEDQGYLPRTINVRLAAANG